MEKGAIRPKPLFWIGSSRKDILSFPSAVKLTMGFALWQAMHNDVKPLKALVVEVYGGNTYRAVYTVRYARVVYVLHAFQMKSNSGKKTFVKDIDPIWQRRKRAEKAYANWKNKAHKKD